jgi:alpha-tubulin suppressor-like RCC1 family protein
MRAVQRVRVAGVVVTVGVVAGVVMAVPGPAGAAVAGQPGGAGPGWFWGGRPVITNSSCAGGTYDCGKAGYQAQAGAGFRYAHALITIPAHRGDVAADPAIYVALDRSTARAWDYVRAGVRPCQPGGLGLLACPRRDRTGWELFAQVRAPGAGIRVSAWAVPWCALGRTASASLFYSQARHTIRASLAAAGGPAKVRVFSAPGVRYLRVQALADWTAATASPRPAPATGGTPRRLTQFDQVAYTTTSGQYGTLGGLRSLRPVEATTTGRRPPAGVLVAWPSRLRNDRSGRGCGGSFSIWLAASPPPRPSGWAAVSAGPRYTCAVTTGHTLWCWGNNNYGQLGDGDPFGFTRYVPVQAAGHTSDWAAVSAAGAVLTAHTCAVKTNHTLWCWGDNAAGQLGDGTTTGSDVPVQAAGHTRDWAAVSASAAHTCAVKTNHTLWCWGANYEGEFGDGTTTGSDVPVQAAGHTGHWAAVSAGTGYTCAVKTNHTLWCWGTNLAGELGIGSTVLHSYVPVQVAGHTRDWAAVSAESSSVGTNHTCAVKTNHTLWCWGADLDGELGDGAPVGGTSYVPVQVAGHTRDWAAVSADATNTCAVKTSRTLWCWGGNGYGQLGNGTTGGISNVPVQVAGHTRDWAAVSTGDHTCAVKTNHTLWCWGDNKAGALGIGSTVLLSPVPQQVPAPQAELTR